MGTQARGSEIHTVESADAAMGLGHMQITVRDPKVTKEEFFSTTSWMILK